MRDEPDWVHYEICEICGEWFDPFVSNNKNICDKCLKKEREKMELMKYENSREIQSLNPDAVLMQVKQIQDLMNSAMKKDEHYGVIPGTHKPSLLKAGAEKLSFMFRLVPEFDIERIDLEKGHREYIVKCKLRHIPSEKYWGEGVGSCSTMESKYRYRTGEVEYTGKPVPKEYWTNRDQNLIGGDGFKVKKNPKTGRWEIVRAGKKIENENIADVYNTVLKMAKKRAFVDAILTSTAASDIFTQDVEEIVENIKAYEGESEEAEYEEVKENTQEQPQEEQTPANGNRITEKQRKRMFAIAKEHGVSHEQIKEIISKHGYEKTIDILANDYEMIVDEIVKY